MSTAESASTAPCGNDDCDKCDPKPRWRIRARRIQHITYEREIKAATAEEALKIFDEGTAWPTSYDDRYGDVVQQDEPVIAQITGEGDDVDAHRLAHYREDCCYHDLPAKLEAAGLGHLNHPDEISAESDDLLQRATPTSNKEVT